MPSDYKCEFADYDESLPDLAPLIDASWHNDVCPCFVWEDKEDPDLSGCRIELWCDYLSPELREFSGANPQWKRFNVLVRERESGDVLASPFGAETLDELREACNVWYETNVGYRPDSEEDNIPIGKLVADTAQMVYFHNNP